MRVVAATADGTRGLHPAASVTSSDGAAQFHEMKDFRQS
jgi:hypothetical protein